MTIRTNYKTRQRETLINYLESVQGDHTTVNDICAHFKSLGLSIGQATVYRQLEKLVDEGIVSKYIIDANTPACFEYIGAHSHEEETCFHCKCEKCGKLIHMHCDELSGIGAHLLADHHFKLNPNRTVFYGVCSECLGVR